MFNFNTFKLLQSSFSTVSPNQKIRKDVWCFTSIISIFIFGGKQKYLNIMKKKKSVMT